MLNQTGKYVGRSQFGWWPDSRQAGGRSRTASDLNRVNSYLNLRVADIWGATNNGATKVRFFSPSRWTITVGEWRCYMRDPDGYLIEVGQYTQVALNYFKESAGGSTPAEAE